MPVVSFHLGGVYIITRKNRANTFLLCDLICNPVISETRRALLSAALCYSRVFPSAFPSQTSLCGTRTVRRPLDGKYIACLRGGESKMANSISNWQIPFGRRIICCCRCGAAAIFSFCFFISPVLSLVGRLPVSNRLPRGK